MDGAEGVAIINPQMVKKKIRIISLPDTSPGREIDPNWLFTD
jgi:hypothetical protein